MTSTEPIDQTQLQCHECGAAVESTQRYCVVCGAHRQGASDPAARYIAGVTAASRSAARARTQTPRRRATPGGLWLAIGLALLPLAVAVGILLGRSSNNGDARLDQQLSSQRAEIADFLAAGSTTGAAPASTTPGALSSTTGGASAASHSTATKAAKAAKAKAGQAKAKAKVTTTASKAAAAAAGSSIASSLDHANGSSYLSQAANVPETVVVK